MDGDIGYDHLAVLADTGQLRVGLADPGSLNLGAHRDGVPAGSFVYRNSFDLLSHALDVCRTNRLGPSLAIYEPGFLRATLAWWRAGQLPPGAMIKLYFSTEQGLTGAPFGMPPTRASLDAYLELLDGCPVPWAVSVAGGDVVGVRDRTDGAGCGRPPARGSRVLRRRPPTVEHRVGGRSGRAVRRGGSARCVV